MLKQAVQQGRIEQTQNDERGTLKWEGFLCSSFIAHRSSFQDWQTFSASC